MRASRVLVRGGAGILALVAANAIGVVPAVAAEDPARHVVAGVPQGRITDGVFESSAIFPGTRRDYRVYVPAQYQPGTPARLMVFMDGLSYAKADGAFRVPTVLDNLIHAGDLRPTVVVFVNPGTIPPTRPDTAPRSNRSFEYDALGDRYARFLAAELLPAALAGIDVSTDPRDRAVCGISSGGICAFTAAWERPDLFGRVLSHIGSFTDIRGGWAYPGLVRRTKDAPKPIRVYLQEGRDDLDNLFGNWPLANESLAAALRFAGYQHRFVMTDGGHSGVAGGAILPDALRWLWSDEPGDVSTATPAVKADFTPHADAVRREGVPRGTVERMPSWTSTIFPGTVRDWSVYVPAQYRPEVPAAVMVFQDGHDYVKEDGRWRVPVVFDNLIAAGAMPPTIAVFVDPGHDPAQPAPPSPWRNSNRSLEYDSLGDRYARFVLEEILAEVGKRWTLTADPAQRAIGGASSGGICAFTAAWERPDAFGKVYSTIGSYTALRGGDAYPSLVRKTEPKPIRVYLADTSGDLSNQFGSWPLANRTMAAALTYMGYDLRFDWAEGFAHDGVHGGQLFPDAMRWLWRSERHEPAIDTKGDLKGDLTLLRLLVPGASWEVVADGLGFADAPCTDAAGNFYYCDMKAPEVVRIAAADGSRTTICREAVSGLEFGPDGRLYGCQGAKQRVVAIDPATGAVTTLAEGIAANDLAITADGFAFVTETRPRRVIRIRLADGATSTADEGAATGAGDAAGTTAGEGLRGPNGIALSNDGGTLAVSDHRGAHVWTFRVGPEGALDARMPTMTMRRPINPKGEFAYHQPPPYLEAASGDGMAVDRTGRWYVTSALGVQVFDPTGRLCGVLPKPKPGQPLTSCILAGPGHEWLHITNGDTIYRRRLAVGP
jgi:enterochelin esterase-like enzyme/sugar lactone lactonase YvrE